MRNSAVILPTGARVLTKTYSMMIIVRETIEDNGPLTNTEITTILNEKKPRNVKVICRRRVARALKNLLENKELGIIIDVLDTRSNKYHLMR